jgi:hypothetical protein
MTDERVNSSRAVFTKRIKWAGRIAWLTLEHIFNIVADVLEEHVHVLRREVQLFSGMAFIMAGVLHFQNGKNCDGNTADYLACTHPSTYYYYGWVEITLVIVGAFLLTFWLLRRQTKRV